MDRFRKVYYFPINYDLHSTTVFLHLDSGEYYNYQNNELSVINKKKNAAGTIRCVFMLILSIIEKGLRAAPSKAQGHGKRKKRSSWQCDSG